MNDQMRQLVSGRLRSGELPRTINVWDLKAGLGDLCSSAFAQQVEWGGCIVLEEDRLDLCHPVRGRKLAVEPKCDREKHDALVGFAHVHLPDDVSGKPYLGFSERDFRATLADGENLSLVCNGPEVFVLVRTADRTQPRKVIDDREFQRWESLYDDAIERARRKAS